MIIVCEPQCKYFSHEKVNSGFIYALRLAYPQETIRFYADISHLQAINKILIHDNIIIENIEFIPIVFRDIYRIRDIYSINGMLTYYALFNRMFSDVLKAGANKIFFLSFNPAILYIVKKLKQKPIFMNMKFTFVLHGGFENIAIGSEKPIGLSLPINILPIKKTNNKSITQKIRETKFIALNYNVARAIKRFITQLVDIISTPWQYILSKHFSESKMLLWKHSVDFKYVSLSPHIIINAEKYIDVKKLNIFNVVLPMVFAKPTPQPNNNYVKFAVFGSLNSLMMHNVAVQLSKKELKKFYEIRIIGMNNRGTEGFPNITCPSSGKDLDRGEMEKYASDIDMFLVLHDISRYRLSCSNSILESLSYMKPIMHFNNDCINSFNTHENPIGICCNTIEEFVDMMADVIENYQSYTHKFAIFRNNILALRRELAMENSVTKIKESFTH